jgi:hypothetical protein
MMKRIRFEESYRIEGVEVEGGRIEGRRLRGTIASTSAFAWTTCTEQWRSFEDFAEEQSRATSTQDVSQSS